MTSEPTAFVTRVAGAVPRLEVDGDLGDEVAFIATGFIAADGLKGTEGGPTRTIGIKATELIALDAELAEELVLAVRRHGRQRTMSAQGLEPLPNIDELADEDPVLDPGPTPEDIVRDYIEGGGRGPFDDEDDLELEDDDVVDVELGPTGEAALGEATLDDLRKASAAVDEAKTALNDLEAAWSYVDVAFPGYGDLSEGERRERLAGITLEAFAARHLLALEREELGGSDFMVRFLERTVEETVERYRTEEPWPGYAKATVDAIVGRLDETREADVERVYRPAVLEHVAEYEFAHKARKTIAGYLDEELLGHGPEVGVPDPDPDFEPEEDLDADEEA